MRPAIFTLLLAFFISCASANELLGVVVDVPVTNDWLFVTPIKPKITVRITNETAEATTAHIQLLIKTDKKQYYTTLSQRQEVETGQSVNIDFEFVTEPGFYHCEVIANGIEAKSFVFGVDPQEIISAPDFQPDFINFWHDTKAELAMVDGEYTMTEIPSKSTAARKVYLIEMRSLPDLTGEVIARAYYAEPTSPGKYPALIHYKGYDAGISEPKCMGGDDFPEYAELAVSTRGQEINNRPPYTNPYGEWFTYGFESQHDYYYR